MCIVYTVNECSCNQCYATVDMLTYLQSTFF